MEVRIQNGIVRGLTEHGCVAFKGIPYAKPPVGDLRFLPPEPAENWIGSLDCTHYGPRPIQTPPPWCEDQNLAVYSEDCLNINIWTPAVDNKKRPVLFNIFGGGHMEGSNSELGSEGYRIAKEYDVVFVAPNYRVGALGYLYLPHLLGNKYAQSGNAGLLDQILALKWVQQNIHFFGGDPQHVTIVGQSAGGKSVMDLLVAREASGLFHGAVAMSGALQSIKDISTEKKLTANFLQSMRLSEKSAKKLLDCSAEEIRQAQEAANITYFKAESYGATADGITIPENLPQAIERKEFQCVPLILGHTLQELYPMPAQPQNDLPDSEVQKKFYWKFGKNWKIPYDHYIQYLQSMTPDMAYGESATQYTYVDACIKCANLLSQAGTPLWLYRWDFTGGLIAHHSSDNQSLFLRTSPEKHRLYPQETPKVDHIFREVILHFVKHGTPNCPEIPHWPKYQPDTKKRLLFSPAPAVDTLCTQDNPNFPLQVFRL